MCILETHAAGETDVVKGLIRMVEAAPSLTLFDLTIRGLAPGTYWATIRATGDISRGAASSGGLWRGDAAAGDDAPPKGRLGTVSVGADGVGAVFVERALPIWEMIGRSVVVSRQHDGEGGGFENDRDTLVGVVARSAGVWDNDKTVCSCSGKTLWEEREEGVGRGML